VSFASILDLSERRSSRRLSVHSVHHHAPAYSVTHCRTPRTNWPCRMLPRRHLLTVVFTPAPAMGGEPSLMLWAWETPEDFRGLNPPRADVAYLSREVLLGSTGSSEYVGLVPDGIYDSLGALVTPPASTSPNSKNVLLVTQLWRR